MIPMARKMLQEELLTTYISDLAAMNGCTVAEFTNFFLGYSIQKSVNRNDVPANLEDFCEKNDIVPGVYEMLSQHTALFARLPLMPLDKQAQEMEVHLRHPNDYICVHSRLVHAYKNNICPVCYQENKVVLAPHQIPGVRCCYKHHVPLVNEKKEIMTVDDGEIRIAKFAYSMYTDPIFSDYASTIRACITKINESTELEFELDGKLWEKDSLLKVLLKRQYRFATEDEVVRIAAMLFMDSSDLRSYTDIDLLEKQIMPNVGNSFSISSCFGPMMRITCNKCNTGFYAHPFTLFAGLGCPNCRRHHSEKENLDEIVQALLPGYFVTKHKGIRIQLQNEHTENIINGSIHSIIWKMVIKKFERNRMPDTVINEVSKDSDKKHSIHEKKSRERMGQTSIALNGQKMTIIAYRGNKDMDIQFEDGTIVHHCKFRLI